MNRASSSTLLLCAATLAAGTLQAQRQTAKASFKEGAVKIDYSAPKWQDSFGEAMSSSEMKVWRLGANNPTKMNLTCGVLTADGCAPAGDYNLAMAKDSAGDWDLVLYTGGGFYRDGMKGWHIDAANFKPADDGAAVAEQLMLNVNDKKHLEVAFGPNRKFYPLQLVSAHPTATEEFAGMPVMVNVLALPVEGGKVDSMVGTAGVEARGNKLEWNMTLKMDGDNATLSFNNPRSAEIETELGNMKTRMERMKGRMEGADDAMMTRIKNTMESMEAEMKKLTQESSMLKRFKAKQEISGDVSEAKEAAETLTFSHERMDGGIKLMFGAGKKVATFSVKPRGFMNR